MLPCCIQGSQQKGPIRGHPSVAWPIGPPQARPPEHARRTLICTNKPHPACNNENDEPFLMNNPAFNFALIQIGSIYKGDAESLDRSNPGVAEPQLQSNSLSLQGAHSKRCVSKWLLYCLTECVVCLFLQKGFSRKCSWEDHLDAVLQGGELLEHQTVWDAAATPHSQAFFPFITDPQLITRRWLFSTRSHRSRSGLGPEAASPVNCGLLGKSVNGKVLESFLFCSPRAGQSTSQEWWRSQKVGVLQLACNKPPAEGGGPGGLPL